MENSIGNVDFEFIVSTSLPWHTHPLHSFAIAFLFYSSFLWWRRQHRNIAEMSLRWKLKAFIWLAMLLRKEIRCAFWWTLKLNKTDKSVRRYRTEVKWNWYRWLMLFSFCFSFGSGAWRRHKTRCMKSYRICRRDKMPSKNDWPIWRIKCKRCRYFLRSVRISNFHNREKK